MIDIHTHLGRFKRDQGWFTEAMLVRRMDALGIDRADSSQEGLYGLANDRGDDPRDDLF